MSSVESRTERAEAIGLEVARMSIARGLVLPILRRSR